MKEAQGRVIRLADYQPPDFLIERTELDFDLYEDYATVVASLQLRRNPLGQPGAPLLLSGQRLELEDIWLDSEPLGADRYQVDDESLRIDAVPDAFCLRTRAKILPQENHALEGLYRSRSVFCTQCEAEGFRRITWYLDRPDVMALFRTRVTADRVRYPVLLSNGNRVDSGELDDGRHWVEWVDPFPKPSYLFALVAGDLACLEDSFTTSPGREVSLQIFVEARDLDKCGHAMAALKQAMRWDEEVYGREYDLDVFMIVAIDDFNMGAMENKGLNIFNTSCVLAQPEITTDAGFQRISAIVAHEYFHNWSGNRVTCRDWFQLSLKEGFTVFRDAEFSADTGSRVVKRICDATVLRTQQFAEDAGPMAHPVRPDSYQEINNFYTLTIYEKGAEVVRMIHQLLGAEAFRRGSDLYFERHDGQAVTVEDFVCAMEDASDHDLVQFRRWYEQAGTPVLDIVDDYDEAARRYTLQVRQYTPETPDRVDKKPLHMPLRLGLVGTDGAMPAQLAGTPEATDEFVLELKQASQDFVFEDVSQRPVPSLLRGFSAPVKVNYDYGTADLLLLMRRDGDGFSRWDAGQNLATRIMQEQVAGRSDADTVSAFLTVMAELLGESGTDAALLAQMLSLPSEAYLSERAQRIDVAAIHQARERLRHAVATTLRENLLECYRGLEAVGAHSLEARDIARRSLRNRCLVYLALLEDEESVALARAHYFDADNMSDRLGAFTALVHGDSSPQREIACELREDFLQRYGDETLAMNLWLQVQATVPRQGILADIQSLISHPAYDGSNPNKVRSLVGAWSGANPIGFHRDDDEGYRFLAAQILQHDRHNPQLASRLLTPLTRWRRYVDQHADGMRVALESIAAAGELSPDCYEVVSKSLVESRV